MATSDLNTYKKNVDAWVKATSATMNKAHQLACEGMAHFGEHGDTSYLTYLSQAIMGTEQYVRHSAFVLWLAKYGPFTVDRRNGTVTKNKSADAVELNLKGAMDEPFWKIGKEETKITEYDGENILADLRRVLKRYQDEKHVPKEGVDGTLLVAMAERAIDTLAKSMHASNIDSSATKATTKAAAAA